MENEAIKIILDIANRKGLLVQDILGRSKALSIVAARRQAIREVRASTNMSLPEMGKVFGNRDHTTILHYLNNEGWIK